MGKRSDKKSYTKNIYLVVNNGTAKDVSDIIIGFGGSFLLLSKAGSNHVASTENTM